MTEDEQTASEQRVDRAEARSKLCLQCFRLWYNGQRVCYVCGFEFYPKKIKGMRYVNTTYGKERRSTE